MPSQMMNPLTAPRTVCAAEARGESPVSMLPAVPHTNGYAGAFTGVIGDRLYAGGGANFPDGVMPWNGGKKVWHDTLRVLDLSAPETVWKIIGQLPRANGYGVSVSTEEGIVLIGGGDATCHFRETWLLELAADGNPAFRKMPELPVCLAQMGGALVGRKIHLCGGIERADATEATNAHWMLDLDALGNGWLKFPELPAPGRILSTAAAVNGVFYCMGGCSITKDAAGKPSRTLLRDAWKFSDGRWTRIADLPHALAASGSPAPVAGDSLFLISGDDGSQANLASRDDHKGFSKTILRYDVLDDRWQPAAELAVPPPVTVPVTRWKGEFIFFNGEVKPGLRTPQVFAFDPSTCLPSHV